MGILTVLVRIIYIYIGYIMVFCNRRALAASPRGLLGSLPSSQAWPLQLRRHQGWELGNGWVWGRTWRIFFGGWKCFLRFGWRIIRWNVFGFFGVLWGWFEAFWCFYENVQMILAQFNAKFSISSWLAIRKNQETMFWVFRFLLSLLVPPGVSVFCRTKEAEEIIKQKALERK